MLQNSGNCGFVLCVALIWSICGLNLVISIFLGLCEEDFTLIKVGFVGADPQTVVRIAYFCYGLTAYVSLVAILSLVFMNQRQILPLLLWDMIRLFFTLWCLGQIPSKNEENELYYLFLSYVVMLLFCITVELYYSALLERDYENPPMDFVPPDTADSTIYQFPTSTISTVSERNEVLYTQSRFCPRYLPGYNDPAPPSYSSLVDIAPPPYSSLQLSPANTSVLPAATFFLDIQNGSVEAALPSEDPPPYECHRCTVGPPCSPKSCEELEQVNLSFSGHMDPPELKIESFDCRVGNHVTD